MGREVTVRVGDHFVDPAAARVRFRVDLERERIDVAIHHPAFAHLSPQLRADVAHGLLVSGFGPEVVARWIGVVDVALQPPLPAVDFEELGRALRSLSENATGERFAVLEGRDTEGRPVLVLVNRALKRVDHAELDRHLMVEIRIEAPKPDGFPGAAESRTLDRIEERLVASVRGRGAYLGRVTGAGRRIWHFFERAGTAALVAAWMAEWPDRAIVVSSRADPSWEAQRALDPVLRRST